MISVYLLLDCACSYKKLNLVRGLSLYRNMVAVAFYYSAARVKRLYATIFRSLLSFFR